MAGKNGLAEALSGPNTPALVMRAVENGRAALENGETDKGCKMLASADALCIKAEAPPPVHGLVLRALSDGLAMRGDLAGAREALERGVKLCKAFEGRPGMPAVLERDLNGRLGDLHAALGELERTEGHYKEALRALRRAVDYIDKLGSPELSAAAINRFAYACMAKGDFKRAKSELLESQEILTKERESGPLQHAPYLLSAAHAHLGLCEERLGNPEKAREHLEQAIQLGSVSGNAEAAAEAEAVLHALNSAAGPSAATASTDGVATPATPDTEDPGYL